MTTGSASAEAGHRPLWPHASALVVGISATILDEILSLLNDPEGQARGYELSVWIVSPIVRVLMYAVVLGGIAVLASLVSRKGLRLNFVFFAWLFFAAGLWDLIARVVLF